MANRSLSEIRQQETSAAGYPAQMRSTCVPRATDDVAAGWKRDRPLHVGPELDRHPDDRCGRLHLAVGR